MTEPKYSPPWRKFRNNCGTDIIIDGKNDVIAIVLDKGAADFIVRAVDRDAAIDELLRAAKNLLVLSYPANFKTLREAIRRVEAFSKDSE